MICPSCGKTMLVVEDKGVEFDWCRSCGGTWFDSGEIEVLLGGGDADGPKNDFLSLFSAGPSSEEVIEDYRRLSCPRCGRKMKKMRVGGSLVIDSCAKGHGLWFDYGELGTIIGMMEGKRPERRE